MVSEITNGVQVSVETHFHPDYSSPGQFHYVFTYRVEIENKGEQTVKLLRRHWYITDGNAQVREVEGEGVVGQQPTIEPGQAHFYTSGCNLRTEMGKMHGHYIFERIYDGKQFQVAIPEFILVVPYKLN